ncbi:cellulase family glycosylhydrolase [Actinoplanes palleronii]|uniref:Glycoside hydrolase family 5 domain-containing protein n=1 Tax=Actinoplanes palleronii TaxID=113570 RepID=A0ABQ4BI69_9ACTN|nr:cellulase family glycosylhydrolase [Actinoplanes palleronii]GIE70359.1 hypothetical protein Apa02nite_064670 [Actinoplanes palleronii]
MSSARLRTVVLSCLLTTASLFPAAPAAAVTDESPAPAFVAQDDSPAPTLAGRLAAVQTAKTMNYYPSGAGWSAMWTRFDPSQVDVDLAKVAALGADSVRVVVFPRAFGYPRPHAAYAAKLRKFVSIAEAHGLGVKFTLFDWWARYYDTKGSAAWAAAVLAPYADDPRVLAVELKNEMSPDDPDAVAWMRDLIPAVRAAVPAMPLTVSVNGQAGPTGLARLKAALDGTPLDFYDFHFYGASEQALTDIREAQASVAPDPLVIGETGLSTAAGSAGEQAAYLARVFRAAALAGVGSVAPWTLTDFSLGAIPSNSAVSTMPAQYEFGLYRIDGSPKPAASVVRAAWAGEAQSDSVLDLSFESDAGNSPWRGNLTEAGAAELDPSTAHDGGRSMRFAATTRSALGLPSLRISPIGPVHGGQAWSAAAWTRGTDATGVTEIALSWFDADGRWIGQDTSARLPLGTTDWTQLTVSALAPPAAAGVQLHLKCGDNTGATWFDDISLTEKTL